MKEKPVVFFFFCISSPSQSFLTFLPSANTDTDECKTENVCGLNASCINTQGSYYCVCNAGYALKSGKSSFSGQEEQCEGDE